MGLPWKKLFSGAKAALSVGDMLGIPGTSAVITAIHVVESNLTGLKGPQKKDAAVSIAKGILAQSGIDDAILESADVQHAIETFIDAYVAAQNALALAEQAREALTHTITALKSAQGAK